MTADLQNITRKASAPLKVYCLPGERAEIESMAQASGHSVSTYLRLVGQGYRVTSILDFEHVQSLAKVNGDLGRLGGLLKLWLSDETKLTAYDMVRSSRTIVAVLDEVRANQAKIREVMTLIVTPLPAKILAAKTLAAKNQIDGPQS